MKVEQLLPEEIEKKSFEIITAMLGDRKLATEHEAVIKRVIHTTADFEYADTLTFTNGVVDTIAKAIQSGAHIVTDTNMAKAGINRKRLQEFGGDLHCFISDSDVMQIAKERKTTRAAVSMEKAAALDVPLIFAIGNAPTALLKLCDMIQKNEINPIAIIGVPVGFVNVIESKEALLAFDIPSIVAQGRKGGSNVAAAICNAILYSRIAFKY